MEDAAHLERRQADTEEAQRNQNRRGMREGRGRERRTKQGGDHQEREQFPRGVHLTYLNLSLH